jgi:hypothetical protein
LSPTADTDRRRRGGAAHGRHRHRRRPRRAWRTSDRGCQTADPAEPTREDPSDPGPIRGGGRRSRVRRPGGDDGPDAGIGCRRDRRSAGDSVETWWRAAPRRACPRRPGAVRIVGQQAAPPEPMDVRTGTVARPPTWQRTVDGRCARPGGCPDGTSSPPAERGGTAIGRTCVLLVRRSDPQNARMAANWLRREAADLQTRRPGFSEKHQTGLGTTLRRRRQAAGRSTFEGTAQGRGRGERGNGEPASSCATKTVRPPSPAIRPSLASALHRPELAHHYDGGFHPSRTSSAFRPRPVVDSTRRDRVPADETSTMNRGHDPTTSGSTTRHGRRRASATIYDEDHEAFRDVVKEFVKRYATEESAQAVGGGRRGRPRHVAPPPARRIIRLRSEEFWRRGHAAGLPFPRDRARGDHRCGPGVAGWRPRHPRRPRRAVHRPHGTQEQKEKWLPGMATGDPRRSR